MPKHPPQTIFLCSPATAGLILIFLGSLLTAVGCASAYKFLGLNQKQVDEQVAKDQEAITAYSKALALEPANPEIMNNYAWLLLVTESMEYRNPVKALSLAVAAANRSPTGYILDTLATAYWANGDIREAVLSAQQAILHDPANSRYYEEQIEKFTTSRYEQLAGEPYP